MKKEENIIKIGDIIVIAALLLLCLVIFLTSLPSQGKYVAEAVVTVNGEEYGRYPLSTDCEITVEQNGYVNIIEIKDGAVRVRSADCPDRTCVNQGWITRGGEVIVCLPAKLTVTLEGAAQELDSIVY